MPKPKNSPQEVKDKLSSTGLRVAIFTTIITASVGLLGTIVTAYLQDIYRPRLWARLTQTAEAVNQPWLTSTAEAFLQQEPCPPPPKQAMPTEVAIMRQYVNVDRAGVYAEMDQSINPFQTLYRNDSVEVLHNTDYLWACVTYARNDVRIYGYMLRDQLNFDFELTQTADAKAGPTALIAETSTVTP